MLFEVDMSDLKEDFSLFLEPLKQLWKEKYPITYILYENRMVVDPIEFEYDSVLTLEQLIAIALEKRTGVITCHNVRNADWVDLILIKHLLDHIPEYQRKELLDRHHYDSLQLAHKFVLDHGFIEGEPFTREDLLRNVGRGGLTTGSLRTYVWLITPRELTSRLVHDPFFHSHHPLAFEILPFIDEYNANPAPDLEATAVKIRDYYAQKWGMTPQKSVV